MSPDQPASSETVGDLAIVLHTHMPYVEGFDTWPFGEEWLFDAVVRSHLPVLKAATKVTMSVTPVLADQLEAGGVAERMEVFLDLRRVDAHEREATEVDGPLRVAAEAEAQRYRASRADLRGFDGNVLSAFADAQREGRVALMGSAASHAVLPMLATRAGARLQIDAGLRSHERRFGASGGFWLPECAYRPGLDAALAERDIRWTCLDQSASESELDALAPLRLPSGLVGFAIDWPTVELVWSTGGYPADSAYLDSHRRSERGTRLWRVDGEPYDPEAAADRAAEHADDFLAAVRSRLDEFSAERDSRGLCVFAIDTELFGEGWGEGPTWLAEVSARARSNAVELVTLPEAMERHEPERRDALESSWGEGKDFTTWDAPEVADMAWTARQLELRLVRAAAEGVGGRGYERALRELLALQSSDWAFMVSRSRASEYGERRAAGHAEALCSALAGGGNIDPSLRNLAPDLDPRSFLTP